MKNKKVKNVTKIPLRSITEIMNLLPHITDEDIKLLQEKGLVSGGLRLVDWEMAPWKILLSNMKLSAESGTPGGQMRAMAKSLGKSKEEIDKIYKKFERELDSDKITPGFLKRYFEEVQNRENYWTGIKIDPESIFTKKSDFFPKPDNKKKPKWLKYPEKYSPYDCEAMSTDRIENDGGYTVGDEVNFVITTRGINKMRGSMDHDTFLLSLDRQGISINPNLKPLLEKLKKENKE